MQWRRKTYAVSSRSQPGLLVSEGGGGSEGVRGIAVGVVRIVASWRGHVDDVIW